MSDVRGNILSAIVKNGAKIDLTREGLYGVDLCREGKIFTEWPRIGKIIVDREEVTLIERSSTLVKDENGMIRVHHYVDPAELLSRKNSDLRDGQGKKVFNDKGQYVYYLALPKATDKRDPRVINCWIDFQGAVIFWARQSGQFATMKDRRFVYNLDIPEFDFKVPYQTDEISDAENLRFDSGEEHQSDKISQFGSYKTYATKEEFVQELRQLAAQKQSGVYTPVAKPKVVLPSFDWQSLQLGSTV